jgi:Ni/Fe-hydrogenase 1 B-type cytochrome subunit
MPVAAVKPDRHARWRVGTAIAVYVWEYPIRLFHWALVISLGALSFTGYYIHNPFIVGQTSTPFLMGWFRFAHEAFGMIFISIFLIRISMLFIGNRWEQWRAIVPYRAGQWKEMVEVAKFYMFIRPSPVAKVGHNALAAASYCVLYALLFAEIVTGLVMFNIMRHSPILTPIVGWIPRVVSIPNLRLIHYCLMFVFIAFGIMHVHLSLTVSRAEKRGLIDSIFTGYKIVPVDELEEDDRKAIELARGKRLPL